MTEYLKSSEEFSGEYSSIKVKPLTKRGEENFSVWDNQNKKFVREGETINVNGRELEVNKYIKLSDEEKKRWRRNLKVHRDVIHDGEEKVYPMPPTVNEELEKTMRTVDKMGGDPMNMWYEISRKKTGPEAWNVEYSVSISEDDEGDEEPDVSLPEPEIDLDLDNEELELTRIERKYVEACKKKYPDPSKFSLSGWTNVFSSKTGITKERAEKIVQEYIL